MLVYDVPTSELQSGDKVTPQSDTMGDDITWQVRTEHNSAYGLTVYCTYDTQTLWTLDMGNASYGDVKTRFGDKVNEEPYVTGETLHYRYVGEAVTTEPENKDLSWALRQHWDLINRVDKALGELTERVAKLERPDRGNFPYIG